MSGAKNFVKGGWHPEKDSWRGDFKGINQIASLVGKGKKTNTSGPSRDHRSAPLSTLKDPAVFGPPPKNVNYHGSGAVQSTAIPAKSSPNIPEEEKNVLGADRERERTDPPPMPVRANTTISAIADTGQAPLKGANQYNEAIGTDQPSSRSRPQLPPRLPPRGSSDTSTIQVNQGALNRLGQAGISVPGFDIGGKRRPLTSQGDDRTANTTHTVGADGVKASQVKDLGSRFSKLSASPASADPPGEGTSFAQKQAALRTASSLYKDPTSVSVSDATAAASTANNFRQRHGSQVAQGWKAANSLNDQLGLTGGTPKQMSTETDTPSTEALAQPSMAGHPSSKKAPPPPPPKKRELSANVTGALEPPPIPLASKPR